MKSAAKACSTLFLFIENLMIMEIHLPYKVIKNEKQYNEYCKILYDLTEVENLTAAQEDVIELLVVLVEAYDRERYPEDDEEPIDPVSSLKFVMEQNRMKAADLARELGVSKSLVSDILNYRRGFSKAFIRKLGVRFSFRQELWNRPYKLIPPVKSSKTSKAAKVPKSKKAVRPAPSSITKAAKPVRRVKASKSTKPTIKR